MNQDNPAARLLNILEKGKDIAPATSCRAAWSKLLNVDVSHKSLLMGRLGLVMALPANTIDCLNKIEDIKIERYLHWESPLDTAFSQNNLNGQWQDFIKYIDEHVINYLSATSDLLSHKTPEPCLSQSHLDNILESTKSLVDEIKNSELPDKVKAYMVLQLHKLCYAVEEYQITGVNNISTTIEAAFGHGILNTDSIEASKVCNSAKKFWQLMANVALVLSIATGVQKLEPTIRKMLPDINFESEVEIIDKLDNNE